MDPLPEFSFDKKTYRHYMNGFGVVMHCHHYMSLLTKLALDTDEFGGIGILIESVEDSVRPIFDDYIEKHGLTTTEEKLGMAAAFYEIMGMGKMEISGTESEGEAVLNRSHVDQGWIMRFGEHDRPVNYWTGGYLAAAFSAAFNRPARSYEVRETKSMAAGDSESRLQVKARQEGLK